MAGPPAFGRDRDADAGERSASGCGRSPDRAAGRFLRSRILRADAGGKQRSRAGGAGKGLQQPGGHRVVRAGGVGSGDRMLGHPV